MSASTQSTEPDGKKLTNRIWDTASALYTIRCTGSFILQWGAIVVGVGSYGRIEGILSDRVIAGVSMGANGNSVAVSIAAAAVLAMAIWVVGHLLGDGAEPPRGLSPITVMFPYGLASFMAGAAVIAGTALAGGPAAAIGFGLGLTGLALTVAVSSVFSAQAERR